MANTNTDDVALLKEELAQFLLSEIATAQGGAALRREVAEQVAAVIDQILDERLKPVLDNLERQAAEQSRQAGMKVDDALARLKSAMPADKSPVSDQKLSEIAATLDQLRQRVGRVEDAAKPPRVAAATAQPMQAPGRTEAKLADERIAAPRATSSSLPRWMFWLLLLLLALTVLGLGNLYYEKLSKPEIVAPPIVSTPKPTASAPVPVLSTPHPQAAVSVPPQNPVAIAPVTPTPTTTLPIPVPMGAATAVHLAPPPQPASRIPADFAIERGWLAAQPFAVDPRLARRVGSNDTLPTLKSLVCGASPNCSSDALMTEGMAGKQLIALQMLMSQIGDRFCSPRRSVAVTGLVSSEGLSDLAAIAKCAGGGPASCRETQNRVCPPDSDALQSGSQAARAVLLRWALWKTGST